MRIVPRTNLPPGAWNDAVTAHPSGWWWHREEWLRYQLAYRPGNRDVSFAVLDGAGAIVALVPLLIARGGDGAPEFSFSGEPSPLACISTDATGAIAAEEIERLGRVCRVVRGLAASGPFDASPPPPLVPGAITSAAHRVVMVSQPDAALWRDVRTSYRALIHRGKRAHTIMTGAAAHLFFQYAALHLARYTTPRAEATYALQAEWLRDGHAMVAVAERTGACVGAAYWIVYKDSAYYGSGAYAEDNVSHAIIWRSLLALRARGVRAVDLGWQGRARTEKESAIEFQKRGFGGADVPVQIVEVAFDQATHPEGRNP